MTPTGADPTQHTDSSGRDGERCHTARPELAARLVQGPPTSDVVTELITIAVCAPLVPALMVAVAVYRWPLWWLIVAGMLTAWTADAVRALARHAVAAFLTFRRARQHDQSRRQHATPGERDIRAGDPR
jgi:hypothetical protein